MTCGDSDTCSDPSLLNLFITEIGNNSTTLSDNLLALEKDEKNPAILGTLLRAAHSSKGAARVVGIEPIVQLTHAMEDVFVGCQKGKIRLTRDHIDLLFKIVDLLHILGRQPERDLTGWLTAQEGAIHSFADAIAAILTESEVFEPVAEMQPPLEDDDADRAHSFSMLDLFRQEIERHCDILTEDLLLLEKDSASPEILESLMRAAHSIKGAARIVEIDAAEGIAHAMEDVFVNGQYGKISFNRQQFDLLLNGVDILNDIAQLPEEKLETYLAEKKEAIDSLIRSFQKDFTAEDTAESDIDAPSDHERSSTPGKDTAEPVSPPAPTRPARRAEDQEGVRSIRISAKNMSRLMGLAGEMLIESKWLPVFVTRLHRQKKRQDYFLHMLDTITDAIGSGNFANLTSGQIIEMRKNIEASRTFTAENIAIAEAHGRQAVEISHRLYHEAIASRMLHFSHGVKGFSRMVRDLSRELGKNAKLDIIGADTPVDRDILEKIESPLNHLIRNALDHGIENPDDREKSGKPREATITLEARHHAGMLNIIVSDDGRGIDVEAIRRTVIEKDLVAEDIARSLGSSELIEFLFLPNFSTRKTVSKVSGRGVGMDVVHSVVHEVRGVIYSSTKLHQWTRFELQLPLTLSVMRALIAEVSQEPYALPLVNIDHVIRVPREIIKVVQSCQYFTFDEKRIGLVEARQVLQVAGSSTIQDTLNVVIISDRVNQYGLIVDRFWGIRDLVVQPLDSRLGKIKDINAASVLEDGTPVLILDVEDMVRSMDILISDDRLRPIVDKAEDNHEDSIKRILVVDDSITVREVEKKLLTAKGYTVNIAVDGIDALNSLHINRYDLLVTDIDMPRMDGIELVHSIRREPKLATLPIIIVSYKDRVEDRNRGLEAGADYYLTKGSFQDETLVNAVRDLIGEA